MAETTKLRKLRGTIKARLTRIKSKVEQLQEELATREEVETYLARLEEIKIEFENVQRAINDSTDCETTVGDATEEAEFEERYFETKIKLKRCLHIGNAQQVDSRASSSDEVFARVLQQQGELIRQISLRKDDSQASGSNGDAITRLFEQQTQFLRSMADASVATNPESRVKLPVVKLPTFDGRTEEWKRFAETFQSMIHSNESIPNIQKFQYLVTSLSGSAAKIIESIELTDANYTIAWGLLKRRFDDPRAIKKRHIQCLFKMPKIDKESATAIRGLVDYTLKHLRVLKSLDLPTDAWGELVIHMIKAKLDATTLRAWEQSADTVDATLTTLTEFLERRCQMLERIEARSKDKEVTRRAESDKQKIRAFGHEKPTALANTTEAGRCYLCRGEHFMYRCEKFLALSVDDRLKEIRRLKLCINCLRNDHFVKACKMGSCRECSQRHNTLCHRPTSDKGFPGKESRGEQAVQESGEEINSGVAVHHVTNGPARKHVLMATVSVNAAHPNGSMVPLRILLDSASEAHFITHSTCNRLGVKRDRTSEIVTGLSGIESAVRQRCEVVIRSRCSNVSARVCCFIVPKITKMLPSIDLDHKALRIPSNIKLADPEFHKQGSVDMLIGAEFFFDWLESGRIELGENRPVLQNTRFGWIVAGTFTRADIASLACNRDTITTLTCSLEHCETLNQSLSKFWELENYGYNAGSLRLGEARESDEFFDRTTTRTDDGRFVVRLPFVEDPETLGESREIAYKRLKQLERRFKNNKILRDRYIEFMRDYLESGHMSPVIESSSDSKRRIVYLPHHGVIKEESTSTKLRAVFDASSKTSSGRSLNDILRIGPTKQCSLVVIVSRFRFYKVALTGDIRKMYRQVLVHSDDRDCQRILWRFDPDETVQEFRLNTVTYGEASSSYLAVNCIFKLAEEAEREWPMASLALVEQTYIDDILAGANSVKEAAFLQEQLTEILSAGGFEAHKWCSNRAEVLEKVSPHLREDAHNVRIDANDTIKTLGIKWNPNNDQFQFSVHEMEAARTKREILSAISKLFDPLGLIGPVLTSAKLIMQETWRTECNWDEPLPAPLAERWEQFRRDLNAAEALSIPRRVLPSETTAELYLQGFCDASEDAYGACIYMQAIDDGGVITSRLLCSKSRVAPIKPTSIPRLELCGAVLLARLIADVQGNLRVPINGVQAWSDSQVVLWWIRGDIMRWKPFVANRVSEIIELLPASHWNYVKGTENPADIISRGATLRQLRDSELWWSGPRWLQENLSSTSGGLYDFNAPEGSEEIRVEERKFVRICAMINSKESIIQGLIDKFSSLTLIERVLAYCLRYISNLQKNPGARDLSILSVSELQMARNRIVRYVQDIGFTTEVADLKKGRDLRATSKILQLHPFLDEQEILRVGGRLQYSSWTFERRHPIILPAGDRFSRLLFEREHHRLLHAGQQLLLSSLRERYWPLRGRSLARQVCHECIRCARTSPRGMSQVMGPLPNDRVRPNRAFAVSGVDFAGPITTLVNKGRGRKTNKSYIALFVCFATKAIHLEATSELTTAAFLATLRRFIGRRGRPHKLYSDNATNLVGANREMREVYQFAQTQAEGKVGEVLSNENIEWRFIPPSSPHMGGLWEAGMKACKHHLRRVLGNALFTFEELSTALIQIEACLNSRPLYSLSSDPTDLQPLTPAHFLVGESMAGLPDTDLTDIQLNRLDRWRLVQRALQDFWKRWASEYVAGLQGRTKWKKEQANLQIGDMVVLRDENFPPLKWKLGRVIELHPGHDGLVRVVTIRTENGRFKRAIAKLCKLPVSSNIDDKN